MPVNMPMHNCDGKMSRNDLLTWVNELLNSEYKKIEELSSGAAYCQIMEIMYPGCVGIKKLKLNAKLEHECIFNLRLFQRALVTNKIDKNVPIEKLVKGRFQDNFEFVQWFKKFYDINCTDQSVGLKKPEPLKEKNGNVKVVDKPNLAQRATVTKKPVAVTKSLNVNLRPSNRKRSVSPSTIEILSNDLEKLKNDVNAVEQERDYYFLRLSKIEKLCNDKLKSDGNTEWIDKCLKIIYSTPTGDLSEAEYSENQVTSSVSKDF